MEARVCGHPPWLSFWSVHWVVSRASRCHWLALFHTVSALDAVNSVVGDVFRQFCEDARYTTQSGEVRQITVIRFDPYIRQDIEGIGVATTDPSVWVLLSEVPNPLRDEQVTTEDNETFRIRDVEMKSRRGYARLHLYSEK